MKKLRYGDIMKRVFNIWIKNLRESIADWTYYTDFPKVYKNVDSIKVELNILNSLINSKSIEEEFKLIVKKYPEVLRVIPILLAKRGNEIKVTDSNENKNFNFSKKNYSIEEYMKFMKNTGLFDLLSNHIISDLIDYVKGVEVGLDSNARKNRTGTAMENIVESYIINAGYVKDVTYFKEMNASTIYDKFGIKLDLSDNEKAKAEKRFDFVVKAKDKLFAIEVNFYSSGGSKLNETARSYKMIFEETKNIKGFSFVWITDGIGWHTAKRNLEETFDVLELMFNLSEIESGILNNILK